MYISTRKFSAILYLLAFILPVFKDNSIIGLEAFIWSIMIGIGEPSIGISWLANVSYFFALVVFYDRKPHQFIASGIAIVLALIVFMDNHMNIVETNSSNDHVLWYGYYCWLLSFVVLFSKSFTSLFIENKKSFNSN